MRHIVAADLEQCLRLKASRFALGDAVFGVSAYPGSVLRVECQRGARTVVLDLAPDTRLDMLPDELATHALVTLANVFLGKALPSGVIPAGRAPLQARILPKNQ